MSLDVYLTTPGAPPREHSGIFLREDGEMRELSRQEWDARFPGREPVVASSVETDSPTEVYSGNVTHNLTKMASEAGLYEVLWRPEEIDATKARQLITPLRDGLKRLREAPEHFKTFNPENGWGDYEGFVVFVGRYLDACEETPEADVWVSR